MRQKKWWQKTGFNKTEWVHVCVCVPTLQQAVMGNSGGRWATSSVSSSARHWHAPLGPRWLHLCTPPRAHRLLQMAARKHAAGEIMVECDVAHRRCSYECAAWLKWRGTVILFLMERSMEKKKICGAQKEKKKKKRETSSVLKTAELFSFCGKCLLRLAGENTHLLLYWSDQI